MLSQVVATRYVVPLREGGSLPGLMEADDLGTYVVKFRGAGQGVKALIAEVIVAGLAAALGVRVPDQVEVVLRPELARYEADEEVQDLLVGSVGSNLGVDYLPGAFGLQAGPATNGLVTTDEAARVLWLDAFVANVDRTWRNPNLLRWHRALWCIDHGAALWFHHAWAGRPDGADRFATAPFDIAAHCFADAASTASALDAALAAQLTPPVLVAAVEAVPDEWLAPDGPPDDVRARYQAYLTARLSEPRRWCPGVARGVTGASA